MMADVASRKRFIPAMGVEWLLPLYDPFSKLVGLDRWMSELIDQAALQPLHRVLDVGCGTGSLAILIKRRHPTIDIVGLDPDAKALALAARKARRAGVVIQFDRGFADALGYPTGSFDRVFSSFMFHHLERAEKAAMLREIQRVLKPGGRFGLLDFSGPESAHRRRLSRLHFHSRLSDNSESTVLTLMTGAGLTGVRRAAGRASWGGLIRMAYYLAGKCT